LTERSYFWYTTQDTGGERVKNAESTRTEEESMQQDTTTQMIDPGPSAYVTLLAVQREVGISRGTLKQNPALLAHLPSPVISRGSSEGKDASDGL